MHLFAILIVLSSAVFVDGKTFDCEYTSREYQVQLDPETLSGTNSFADGVNLLLDALTTIQDAGDIQFRMTRSSLKFSNVSAVTYKARERADLPFKITMKSRQKKITEPADFVLKISSPDPTLACTHLKIAKAYKDFTEAKFELDFHAHDGNVRAKSAMSYAVKDPNLIGFKQFTSVQVSDIFSNAAEKVSGSGNKIVADPHRDRVQSSAEFNIRLNEQKLKGVVELTNLDNQFKAEFSFRIKGTDVDENLLYTAQKFAKRVSLVSSIVLKEGSSTVCED